jgi:hypothetical protein
LTSAQYLRSCRDLVWLTWARHPRQFKAIAYVARHDMKVKVKHGLAGCWACEADDRRTVGSQSLNGPSGKFTGCCCAGCEVLWVGCDCIIVVIAGNHQAVPATGRVDVHKCHRPLVLADDRRWQLASQDFAEETVVVSH